MDTYYIHYNRNKYSVLILLLFWLLIFLTYIILIFENSYLKELFSNSILIMSLFIFIPLFGSLFAVLGFGLKLFSKKIKFTIFDHYLDINDGEKKIKFTEIELLKMETILHKVYKYTTGYKFLLKYNDIEKIEITIFTGTSKKEKYNSESLIKFYNELEKKWNNTRSP